MAFDAIASAAVRLPAAVGTRARSSVQTPPAGMASAQVSVSENSVFGENVSEEMATGALPRFLSTSGTGMPLSVELTPTAVLSKLIAGGSATMEAEAPAPIFAR